MDTPQASTLERQFSDDFTNKYANHVEYELSVWDLKLIFGQTEQNVGPQGVMQHTAITLPWPQVKIMAYLLQTNLLVHEYLNGKIRVPGGILPNHEAIKAGAKLFQENGNAIAEIVTKHYEAFVKENPEIANKGLPLPPPKRK